MSGQSVHFKIKINFTVILLTVLLLHILSFTLKGLPGLNMSSFLPAEKSTLKIRRVKTNEVVHPNLRPKSSVMNAGAEKKIVSQGNKLGNLGLKDLALIKPGEVAAGPRPGTRPEVTAPSASRAMNRISLKSKEFKDYSKSFSSGSLSISDLQAGAQRINDAVVSIEVPEGVEPDELNEYELMFYSFQKRSSINFMNSIFKSVDKFRKTYPNYTLPSSSRIVMTARLTYDKEGNVMQIKMVRWTHYEEIQNMFEDIVKNMDQLHNPPKTLWEKNDEFSMFFTLEILNG